jgi:hypothetical protein
MPKRLMYYDVINEINEPNEKQVNVLEMLLKFRLFCEENALCISDMEDLVAMFKDKLSISTIRTGMPPEDESKYVNDPVAFTIKGAFVTKGVFDALSFAFRNADVVGIDENSQRYKEISTAYCMLPWAKEDHFSRV